MLFLGGRGRAGGPKEASISSFAGADGFYDDISDGPVTAHVKFRSGESLTLYAWVVATPPKIAPGLVNITNLDDINEDRDEYPYFIEKERDYSMFRPARSWLRAGWHTRSRRANQNAYHQ